MSKLTSKKINIWGAFFIMVPKIARVSPAVFSAWQIIAVAHAISYGVIAPVTQYFFDSASRFASGQAKWPDAALGLVFLAAAHAIKQALNGTANFMNLQYYRKVEGVLATELHEKISGLSPVSFEDTQVLDEMNKAVQGKDEAVWYAGTILLMLTFYIPYFVCMAFYLFGIKPLLVVSLALVFSPTLITQVLRAKVFSKAEDKSAPVRREFDYYECCITAREYFRETRILGAFAYFRKLYGDSLVLLNKIRFRASAKSDMAELGMQILSLGGYVGILLLLVDSLLNGEISVGAFAAVFGSVDQMFSLMKELIVKNFGAVAGNFGRVRNYLKFMQMPVRSGCDVEIDKNADITLSGVSFTYPAARESAVTSVSLSIKKGETIAVVGENGSGKTTLVRLITGLYLPDEGLISYGGVSTEAASMSSIFKNISAVFQNFQRYQMSLRVNIGISDVNTAADDLTLGDVCAQAGFDKNDTGFANGYDTMLSREFNGVDLSGGEWQRVAIARGLFRSRRGRQVIVLDEPTAAIDPIEETKIYNRFAEIAKDKTAIYVTHRLGSVKLADRIIVMKDGRLAEQGTHSELMGFGGEYARLYKAQEQWYV
ncbi:MAG: ABC transporter ATP-binding protein/permease [Clostridiales bacterium]|nr:ABC transporter ATP-binding protein/permease [Clostridiales bacterium]